MGSFEFLLITFGIKLIESISEMLGRRLGSSMDSVKTEVASLKQKVKDREIV